MSKVRTQASFDVIVVGAGLAGLWAGTVAARQGARVLVIARGLGGTHLGPGTVDVWGYEADNRLAHDPVRALEAVAGAAHPLRLAGLPALRQSLGEFRALCESAGYPLQGTLDRNWRLPTALGAERPTCLAPSSFAPGDLESTEEIILADVPGFRDFHAGLAAANLNAAGHAARAVRLDLPPPGLPTQRDTFATDLAVRLDQPEYRAQLAEAWRGALRGAARLGIPAILGLRRAVEAHQDLSERLGLPVFEIPILPPSVPGMRLAEILRSALEAAGGRLVLGPEIRGWVQQAPAGPRAAGVLAETAGGPRRYAAPAVVLATGGFRHGGLVAPRPGQALESVFDLPVKAGPEWFATYYWEAQPFARFGLQVDARLRPVDADGRPLLKGLYAAGGLLAGADRTGEGSRETIDLACGWLAARQALAGE